MCLGWDIFTAFSSLFNTEFCRFDKQQKERQQSDSHEGIKKCRHQSGLHNEVKKGQTSVHLPEEVKEKVDIGPVCTRESKKGRYRSDLPDGVKKEVDISPVCTMESKKDRHKYNKLDPKRQCEKFVILWKVALVLKVAC